MTKHSAASMTKHSAPSVSVRLTLIQEISQRASCYANEACCARPGSVERGMFERLAEECREIANFIRLRELSEK